MGVMDQVPQSDPPHQRAVSESPDSGEAFIDPDELDVILSSGRNCKQPDITNDHNERVNASVGGKRRAEQRGVIGCEYCGWTPHASFSRTRPRRRKLVLVTLHHVIPMKFQGTYSGDINADENTIVLCPIHAAIADAISGTHDNRKGRDFSKYRGPKTRDELLENLRLLDADPDGWAKAYWPKFDKDDSLNELIENLVEIAEASVPKPSEP
jgi:hypothetical protein